MTIGVVWLISIAIASPIVAGFNDTPDRDIDQCSFNNEKFLIYSSIFSFYIPTIAMIILYYRIFKVIRARAKNAQKKSNARNTQSLMMKAAYDAKKSNNTDKEKEKVNLLSESIFKLKNSQPVEINKNVTNTTTTDTTKIASKASDLNEIVVQETNLDASNEKPKPIENGAKDSPKKNLFNKTNKIIAVQRFQSSAIASSNKEKKVTKTLAIVLIVFLVCWLVNTHVEFIQKKFSFVSQINH